MARFRTGARTALRWILILAFSVAILGLVQLLHPSTVHAEDTGGYPWADAPCLDGACNNDTYNWGYTLTNGHCPPVDPSCLSYPFPNRQHPTAGMGDPWGYSVDNCTSYVAWKINQVLGINISGWKDAAEWADAGHAPAGSVKDPSSYTPVVGDIAQWGPTRWNQYGHVAYVYAVDPATHIASLDEYNGLGTGKFSSSRTTVPGSAGTPTHYIHLGSPGSGSGAGGTTPPLSSYAGTIVQWDNGPNKQETAWFVSLDLKRYWIPDSGTFYCLRNRGVPLSGTPGAAVLNQLRDQTGHWATCGSSTLRTNQYMFRGSSLISSDGRYRLELQSSDGNLVLYGPTGTARWSNDVASDYLVLLPDGDLATYSYKNGETWASNTANMGVSYAVVGTNGALALYAPGEVLKWSTLLDFIPTGSKTTPTAAPPPPPPPTATPTPVSAPPPTVTPTPQPQPVNAYDNYGTSNWVGHAMCRGNPSNSLSMPGGTASQTFTVPGGVATLSSAMVQIDPDSTVTATMSVLVNGNVAATTSALAAGDTHFSFGPVNVSPGDVVTISITFSATYGKIITVYTVGSPGGTFTASNSCPDGAPSLSTTSTGLRAVISGMS